jgi:hypothetical protein
MNPAYQRFLDFFELWGTARLDGLDYTYFEPMTPAERGQAYDFLMHRLVNIEKGGSNESVNGLFRADEARALVELKAMLETGGLAPEAQLLTAWNAFRLTDDPGVLSYIAKVMSDPNAELRGDAAYYAPPNAPTRSLVKALRGMVYTETEQHPLVQAINKLLTYHGVSAERVGKKAHSRFYLGLRSGDASVKTATIKALDESYPIPFIDN